MYSRYILKVRMHLKYTSTISQFVVGRRKSRTSDFIHVITPSGRTERHLMCTTYLLGICSSDKRASISPRPS